MWHGSLFVERGKEWEPKHEIHLRNFGGGELVTMTVVGSGVQLPNPAPAHHYLLPLLFLTSPFQFLFPVPALAPSTLLSPGPSKPHSAPHRLQTRQTGATAASKGHIKNTGQSP